MATKSTEELSWLDAQHSIYKNSLERWKRNERRLRGGEDVLTELRPYQWEHERNPVLELKGKELVTDIDRDALYWRGAKTEHYASRQAEATYVNFPDMFAIAMTGFLMRQAPQPEGSLSFGTLGEVRREVVGRRTAAELVYYNVDGRGNDGSQWDPWWMAVYRRAMATGHRWLFTESPEEGFSTEQDWLDGRRPYLVEYSPTQVPLWHMEEGQLQFAVVRNFRPRPRVEKGKLVGLDEKDKHYFVLVREGYEGLGARFKRGGWWLFNPDKELEDEGDWARTDGQIPMFPIYYDRDRGTSERATFSRAGLTELGQLAVSYMNLGSAWDYDVWDAAGSVQLLLGVSQEAFNIATGLLSMGNKMVPVPKDDQTNTRPDVYDASQGAVSGEVFAKRLEIKQEEARELAAMESTGTPESSGISKRAGFADLKSPRLALMASEIETAQNTAIHFLEQRFGNAKPTGSVQWDREFELLDVLDEVGEIFNLEAKSRLHSATVGVEGMMKAIKERLKITDDELLEKIEQEYRDAASSRNLNDSVENALRGG